MEHIATNAAYNALGLGVLLFVGVKKGWLRWPCLIDAKTSSEAQFLVVMAVLFPAFPVILSLFLGISLKATWGFNAFFLTPTLLLWMAKHTSERAYEAMSWRNFATLMPIFLALMTSVVISNAFTDAARPLALQDAVIKVDDLWAANTENELELVIIASEPALAMTFYSRFHPMMKLSGPTAETGQWLLDVNGCFEGPTAVIFSTTQTDWTDARGVAPQFQGLAAADGRKTNLTITKPVAMYVLGFPDGICL